jgi:hypothetical protein
MRKSLRNVMLGFIMLITALLMDIIFSAYVPNLPLILLSLIIALAGAVVGFKALLDYLSEIL